MVDLFTRLVGRTLGLAPVLQPKPVSMYASGQGMVEDASSQLQFGNELNVDVQRQENTTAFRNSGRGQLVPLIAQGNSTLEITRLPGSSIADSQNTEQLRSPDINPLEPVANELTDVQSVETNESLPRPEQRSSINSLEISRTPAFFEQSNAGLVNSEIAGQDASLESQRIAAQSQIQRSESSVNPPEPLVNQVSPISASQAELRSNRLSGIDEERNSTPASSKLSQSNQRAVVTPKIAPLVPQASPSPVISSTGDGWIRSRESSLQPNSATMVPASPPTIQVTIGRIEVRAVMPSPPPARQRSAPSTPKLSLQDYLKSRSGGNG
jgi:hypothetical protein